ncbi:carboxypeptidase-like regulatory domain-containing protein, partial [Campylobacter fetus subsp. venerealis]
ATVSVAGTSTGTITDIDGGYSITIPDNAELIFSYIGYEPERVRVGSQTVVNVTLRPDATALDEVIVIGYGTTKRSDLTGSVGSVGAEALRER